MSQYRVSWHRNTGHAPDAHPVVSSIHDAYPRFAQHSEQEARLHPSYLLVKTVTFATHKGDFLTNIEWCSAGGAGGNGDAGTGAATIRVRMLVEREPLNASQARHKAHTLALRHRVPLVLVMGQPIG